MLPALIAKIGLPVLVNVLSEVLGGIDNPVTKGAAKALEQVDDALKTGGVSPEQLAEANRHAETLAQMQSEEYKAAVEQVNASLRAEIASTDPYVRRMRPTFGYLMAATWAAQMFGIAYVIIFDTSHAGEVMAAMASLSAIWGVGLSVMGIYVYKRSEEKQAGREVIFWNGERKA
jgi:hypothetical protein